MSSFVRNLIIGFSACLLAGWFALESLRASESIFEGPDQCVVCHGPGMPKSAVAILATRHGARQDPNSPFGRQACENCHGAAAEHAAAQSRGEPLLPPIRFSGAAASPAPEQNETCLNCHSGGARLWFGQGAHGAAEVACASCHRVHVEADPVLDPALQPEVCYDCHREKRAELAKPSAHPVRFEAMSCSSCHDPHRGENEALLIRATLNETCLECHAEKRGPFLWEHAPASEDCSLCHDPHGSIHPALLQRQAPLLCQQCHQPAGHPSLAFTPEAASDPISNRFMLGRACLNCHSQVHGSNDPSGATLHR